MSNDHRAELEKLHRVDGYRLTETPVKTVTGIEVSRHNQSCVLFHYSGGWAIQRVTREWRPISQYSDWDIRTDCQDGSIIDSIQLRRGLRHLSTAEAGLVRLALSKVAPSDAPTGNVHLQLH